MSNSKRGRSRRAHERRLAAAARVQVSGQGRKARMCVRKKAYSSEDAAISGAIKASVTFGDAFKWYRCPYCKKWHIAHAEGNTTGKGD